MDNVNGICCFSRNGFYLPRLFHLIDKDEELFPTIAFVLTKANMKTLVMEKKFQFDMRGV